MGPNESASLKLGYIRFLSEPRYTFQVFLSNCPAFCGTCKARVASAEVEECADDIVPGCGDEIAKESHLNIFCAYMLYKKRFNLLPLLNIRQS